MAGSSEEMIPHDPVTGKHIRLWLAFARDEEALFAELVCRLPLPSGLTHLQSPEEEVFAAAVKLLHWSQLRVCEGGLPLIAGPVCFEDAVQKEDLLLGSDGPVRLAAAAGRGRLGCTLHLLQRQGTVKLSLVDRALVARLQAPSARCNNARRHGGHTESMYVMTTFQKK
jgi:hypothetical protein